MYVRIYASFSSHSSWGISRNSKVVGGRFASTMASALSPKPVLFQPKTVGAVQLKHRVVQAPCTRVRNNKAHVPVIPLMKTYYDRKHSPDPIFKKGELVYIEGRNIRTERPSTKLGDKRYGPFAIQELVGSSAYRVRLPKSWNRVHPVFHVSYLRKHHDSVKCSALQLI